MILMGILALSDDILIEILYFLSPIDVSFGLSATSRHFYNLSNLEKLWQNYCLKYNYQQKGRTKRLLKPWKHVYLTNICLNCSNREKNNGNIIIDCNGGNSKRSSNGMVNQHLISLCSHCFQSVESYHDLSSRICSIRYRLTPSVGSNIDGSVYYEQGLNKVADYLLTHPLHSFQLNYLLVYS